MSRPVYEETLQQQIHDAQAKKGPRRPGKADRVPQGRGKSSRATSYQLPATSYQLPKPARRPLPVAGSVFGEGDT